jgi:hypothetical protein
LHVGSVYLDRKGNRINPDKGKYDKATETRGGNSILKDIDKKCKGSNLHSEWDGILKSLGPPATNSLVGQARAIKDTKGKVETFAETWASESVKKARSAFKGLTFSGAKKCDGHWLVAFDNRKKYLAARNKMQREQLAIAGARLAQLLKTIWP